MLCFFPVKKRGGAANGYVSFGSGDERLSDKRTDAVNIFCLGKFYTNIVGLIIRRVGDNGRIGSAGIGRIYETVMDDGFLFPIIIAEGVVCLFYLLFI